MENIFKELGLERGNGLYITSENKWDGIFPKRIEEFFNSQNHPDAFYCMDNKPLILFYSNPKDKNKIFKSVWNFNESPIVFIIEPDSVEIYNGFKYIKEKSELSKIDNSKYKDDFHYYKLVTGKTWSTFQTIFNYQDRVDYNLLENIKNARNNLIDTYKIDKSLTNKLIGKCIFTRYLIDRNVKIEGYKNLNNTVFVNILLDKNKTKSLFTYLQNKFNGNLFFIEEKEYKSVSDKVFTLLSELMSGSTINGTSIHLSLFDIYDFSIIPVEFISNVYELFIGEKQQAEKGAYYTPIFLVDYILSQTVEKYFSDHPGRYNCKILDPACGSGIFLVEAYRKIIKQYETINPSIKEDMQEYKKILIQLAQDNIFGIDKDSDAVLVAKFSIYLTMLHYQSPPDIENFKFPLLTDNFFNDDFFDPKFDQEERLKNIDFIIGNPPWKRGEGEGEGEGKDKKPLYLQYIDKRKKEEKSEIVISNKEIAQAFLLRTSDFSNKTTKCALIVTSKALYNLNGIKFREYLLKNYFIDKVFELAAVRREVFNNSNDSAIAPAAILFYRYAHEENTDKNTLEHIALKPNRLFSMFKIFSIQKTDYKRVIQKRLKEYDYLWKILVYGSYLDFNFIQRLKNDYQTIDDVISDKERFFVKQGLKRIDGNKKINVSELIGWDFLDITNRNTIEHFYIHPGLNKWNNNYVGYIFRENEVIKKEVFEPPMLLIKETVNINFRSICAISYRKVVFTDKITSIKEKETSSLSTYSIIASILSSSLFSYYILTIGSTTGIMIEQQIHDAEKFSFPYIENIKFSEIVSKTEQLKKSFYEEGKNALSSKSEDLQIEIDKTLRELDEEVLKSFDLSEEEKALVDYAVNITIPMIMKHKGYEDRVFSPITDDCNILSIYANIFLDRFVSTFNRIGLCINVEIWHNENIIGMFFNESPIKDETKENITITKGKLNDDFLKKMYSLGVEKITDRLFIEKDIRGFEKNGFYIIKPNEKKLWHKAIAYLDMYEFANAILTAGKGEANA